MSSLLDIKETKEKEKETYNSIYQIIKQLITKTNVTTITIGEIRLTLKMSGYDPADKKAKKLIRRAIEAVMTDFIKSEPLLLEAALCEGAAHEAEKSKTDNAITLRKSANEAKLRWDNYVKSEIVSK